METIETVETVEVYEEMDMKMEEEVESCCYPLMEVISPKRRKRIKAQEETIEKPKKPRSAYLLYYFDVHQSMQQEYPSLPQSEINKRISESWRRLNVADKGYYLEKAKLEKEGTDTASLAPSQDLSGFRKILPRANYVLMPKSASSSSSSDRAPSQMEVCMEPLDPPPSLTQEPSLPPLALGSEVELAEQCIAIEGLAGEDGAVGLSRSGTLQSILPSSLYSSSSSVSTPAPEYDTQNSTGAGLLLRGEGPKAVGGGYSVVGMAMEEGCGGGAMVQQVRGEAAHLVTIIPGQGLLEPRALPGASSVGSVVMVPVGPSGRDGDPKPYKMAVKTYTRRGRGKCQTPGCPYVYVTRHKPPSCPECGRDLGGKWAPTAKKTQGKNTASSTKPFTQQSGTSPSELSQAGVSPPEAQTAPTSTKPSVGKREGRQPTRESRNPAQRAVATRQPLEGSSAQMQTTMIAVARSPGARVKGQERSGITGPKRPMRPILPAYCNAGRALVQWITVPPDKGKPETTNISKTTTALSEKMSALKPNTLKQLGQAVPTTAAMQQSSPGPAEGSQYILTDKGLKIMSVVPLKQNSTTNLDLGLSTARGRGRCKNPSCDYVYKNRHKPAECPCCGWELSRKNAKDPKCVLLDPYRALTAAQRGLQRQSTLQLLRRGLQIPESEAELQDTLGLIQDLNSPQLVQLNQAAEERGDGGGPGPEAGGAEGGMLVQSGWPRLYESAATHCGLCHYPLFKGGQSSVAGQEECWLLTETLIQTASLQLKVCLNTQCLALHCFTHLHPGLFNIGNRLLVSLDLFLKIRTQIKLGQHPSQAVRTIFDHIQNHPVHALSPEESLHVQELLVSGYWAFECLTVRDYNDMICGVCGIAPKVEIAQSYTHNVLELRNVEFTWPEFGSPDEVHVDDFWLTMEGEAIEQAAFPSDVPITRVDASIIAPFIPPLMRSPGVINTEKDKVLSHAQQLTGDPSVLVRLIHEGQLRPDQVDEHSEEELRAILDCCGETPAPDSTKDELLVTLISLYTRVQNGLPTTPQPPPHHTAGKLSKVCPHQVVCGSKYLVRGETARDHVDLLLSSRFWPPVYVTRAARQVALCSDMQYPELASQMWGRNQGCFSDPMDKPQFVSCAELLDQPYSADLSSVGDNPQVHPVTKSPARWLVHPAGSAEGQDAPGGPEHHSMALCRELEPYISLVAQLEKERKEEEEVTKEEKDGVEEEEEEGGGGKEVKDGVSEMGSEGSVGLCRRRPLAFDNAAYYYLYNRLADFLSSRDIVGQQISQVLTACQPGEVVIRDALYRLGVAQINTEGEGEGEGDGGEGERGVDEETVYGVVVMP